MPDGRSRVLVLCEDVVAERMAGPAIRAFELSRALARHHDVTLATLHRPEREGDGFDVVGHGDDPARLRAMWRDHDVVIVNGTVLARHPHLAGEDTVVVADAYDPAPFEALVRHAGDPLDRRIAVGTDAQRATDALLARADLVVCASDRQRDLLAGQLAVLGRVNPATYDDHPGLGHLLQIVPFGVPDEPPAPTRRPLRDDHPGIGSDDVVLLWGGGLHDWLDPVLLVEALGRQGAEHQHLKAFFFGGGHPTPGVGAMGNEARVADRARQLGLLDERVFLAGGWVPYEDRVGYLVDADVGVSLHTSHLETTYAYRTRIVDYLWAGLPVLCSAGDTLGDLVERHGLGWVVAPGDLDGLVAALDTLADPAARAAAAAATALVAPQMAWDRVAEPLVRFCAHPRRAPDLVDPYRSRQRRVQRRLALSHARRRFDEARRRVFSGPGS